MLNRTDAKAAKKEIYPNLAFLAVLRHRSGRAWREKQAETLRLQLPHSYDPFVSTKLNR